MGDEAEPRWEADGLTFTFADPHRRLTGAWRDALDPYLIDLLHVWPRPTAGG
jgi:hypothetical protein